MKINSSKRTLSMPALVLVLTVTLPSFAQEPANNTQPSNLLRTGNHRLIRTRWKICS